MAFRRIGSFLLGHGFVPVGVERLAGGVNFFQPGLGERGLELLLDHRDAGLERGELVAFGVLRGGQRHLKIVEDGEQFLDQ